MAEKNHPEKFELEEKQVPGNLKTKSYGLGIRHLQILCHTLTLTCLMIARASMGVAVLAMSDTSHLNNTHNNITSGDTYVNGTFEDEMYDNITSNDRSSIETYDWDKKTQSLILSSFFWGYVCMQIPVGIMAKKFGGKPLLLFALVSNSVVCCLVPTLAAMGGWVLVCACRVMMGLTQSSLFPASHTLLGQWLPENERTSYTGIVYGGLQVGTITAMPLCGILAETALGWKLIFYTISGLLAIGAVIWHFFAASSPREHKMISMEERRYIEAGLSISEKRLPTPWKQILTSVPVWALLAPQFGFVVVFVLLFVDMPTYLEKGMQISLKNSALLSALPYVGMLVGGTVAPLASEWIHNRGLLSLTVNRKLFQSLSKFGIASGLIMLSFLGPENKTLAVATLVYILTMSGFSHAGFIVNQLDLSPNFAGVIMSLINFASNIGTVVAPIATSYILQNDPSNIGRWRYVFLTLAAVAIIMNIIYLALATSDRQPWDDVNFFNKQLADPEELKPVFTNQTEKKDTEEKTKESYSIKY